MSSVNKAIACIQILVFLSLALYSNGIPFSMSVESDEFPCKNHACGCKSAADCKAHCCCSSHGNPLMSQSGVNKQKNSFQSFIGSLRCKSGSDVIAGIYVEFKYIPEECCGIPQIPFLCFLTSDTRTRLCEVTVSPPEKPPRCHA